MRTATIPVEPSEPIQVRGGVALPRRAAAALAALATIAAALVGVAPAQAAVSPTSQVIVNEVYGGGGNSGATYTNDFVELYNTGTTPVDLSTSSVQYKSVTGAGWTGLIPLAGTIPPGHYYLVQAAAGTGGTTPLPTPDATGSTAMSGTAGNVALVSSPAVLTCAATACAADPAIIDLVGYGSTANAYAGTGPAPAPGNTTSVSRTAFVNTANNATDFTVGAPTPQSSATGGTTTTEPEAHAIAQIQGTSSASPLTGTLVVTEGVVTASYPTGGYWGFVIQTPGTGGDVDLSSRTASDAVFVYQTSGGAPTVAIGDDVRVTGTVREFSGLTELVVPDATGYELLAGPAAAVTPVALDWPSIDADREKLESMEFAPVGAFTVTNTYSTDQYGEVGLAFGDTPLLQPTDVGAPGSAAATAAEASNAARAVVLDDGASTNFLSAANTSLTPPYVSLTDPVRVGEAVTFSAPMIVDYRNNAWTLSPTSQVTPATPEPARATFKNTRTPGPDAATLAGADLKVASFNVLNYFTTLGADVAGCTSYNDRAGTPITVNSCPGNGPRGAWDAASLARQQAKIVAAINATDADVLGLTEIENSAVVAGVAHADEALATLVAALNAAAGTTKWAYVPSSAELPSVDLQDVISNALIYQPAAVERVGGARALGSQSADGQPFANAREPIGQVFHPVGGGEPFLVVINHFKSKGSAGPLPGDADSGDGQGASNASRVAQAAALRDWVPTVLAGSAVPVADVALVGDFNSYTQEDPLRLLYAAGYLDANTTIGSSEYSYSFSGLSGSLDHVLMNPGFAARATGADIWDVNAGESVALEYSRYNSHGTLFYDASPYRSSDHNPVVVGIGVGLERTTTSLALSATSATYGSSVTATATVTGATSGQVRFSWDGASAVVDLVGGTASVALPNTLGAGTYSVVASFLGTASAAPSASAPVTLTVVGRASTTRVVLVPPVVPTGIPAIAAALVRTGTGLAQGQVTVSVDGTVVSTSTLTGGLALALLPANLAVGAHLVTVAYAGNATTAASSATATLTVRPWWGWRPGR